MNRLKEPEKQVFVFLYFCSFSSLDLNSEDIEIGGEWIEVEQIEQRKDLFWIVLKDETKTNTKGKSKNLPCETVNSSLLKAL